MGVFGPRNPLFQEMGIRAPVWGRGKPNACAFYTQNWDPASLAQFPNNRTAKRRVRKMFSGLQSGTPKTFCRTERSSVVGCFPRCETGCGRCETLFCDSQPKDTQITCTTLLSQIAPLPWVVVALKIAASSVFKTNANKSQTLELYKSQRFSATKINIAENTRLACNCQSHDIFQPGKKKPLCEKTSLSVPAIALRQALVT